MHVIRQLLKIEHRFSMARLDHADRKVTNVTFDAAFGKYIHRGIQVWRDFAVTGYVRRAAFAGDLLIFKRIECEKINRACVYLDGKLGDSFQLRQYWFG